MTESYRLHLQGLTDHSQFLSAWNLMYWKKWVCLCLRVSERKGLKMKRGNTCVYFHMFCCVCNSQTHDIKVTFFMLSTGLSHDISHGYWLHWSYSNKVGSVYLHSAQLHWDLYGLRTISSVLLQFSLFAKVYLRIPVSSMFWMPKGFQCNWSIIYIYICIKSLSWCFYPKQLTSKETTFKL